MNTVHAIFVFFLFSLTCRAEAIDRSPADANQNVWTRQQLSKIEDACRGKFMKSILAKLYGDIDYDKYKNIWIYSDPGSYPEFGDSDGEVGEYFPVSSRLFRIQIGSFCSAYFKGWNTFEVNTDLERSPMCPFRKDGYASILYFRGFPMPELFTKARMVNVKRDPFGNVVSYETQYVSPMVYGPTGDIYLESASGVKTNIKAEREILNSCLRNAIK